MDEDSLSFEQTEKVLQFQDLTGIEDMSLCRDALQRHGWDLEAAVQDQLNIREGRPSVFSLENRSPAVVNETASQQVYVTPSNAPWRWGGPFGFITTFVFRMLYNVSSSFLRILRSLLWPTPRPELTDPHGDVANFKEAFERKYGSTHPTFYQGIYSQAVSDAKHELRFLLVYLHSDGSDDCDFLCRNALIHEDVISYINSNNILFWACNVSSGEGYRVAQTLKVYSYPFIGVILSRNGSMVLAGRLLGPMEPSVLLVRLSEVVNNQQVHLIAARADRLERSVNQSIREQQDEAYMKSLKADQEKARRRLSEERKMKNEENERKRLQSEKEQREMDAQNQKIEFALKVPEEPPSSDPDALYILFKFPSGLRVERRFLKIHTLKDVYYYVFCHPDAPTSFEVLTSFPKRILECNPESQVSLEETGIKKREVLFVQDLTT